MSPTPSTRPASGSRPRHAAQPATRTHHGDALTATTGGFPHVQVLEGETSNGRHRRPESLADQTILRPLPPVRVAGGRRTSLELTPRANRRSTATTSRAGASAPRGRHAKQADPLAITVRPLPVVRDAAEAVKGWALADSGKPPATGSHRAPGTLPIEAWLLVGRHRQQALLGALVAAALVLIALPIGQSGGTSDVNPINAANGAAVTATKPAEKKPEKAAPEAPAKQNDAADPVAPKPAAPAAGESAPAAKPTSEATKPAAPAVLVPAGEGPGKSLITTGSNTVALTFDDGPDPVQTPKILALLKEHQVKAVFCLVGAQAQKHPEMVRQIVADGHTLCNHTWDHSLTIGKDKPEKIQADLRKTNEAINKAAPGAPIPFFRAPGGNFSDKLVETAYGDGMTSLYWEVDPRDWDHPADEDATTHVEKVVKGIQQHVRPGSIVLSHDFNQPDTIAAYEKLLPWLTQKFELGLPVAPPAAKPTTPASAAQG